MAYNFYTINKNYNPYIKMGKIFINMGEIGSCYFGGIWNKEVRKS